MVHNVVRELALHGQQEYDDFLKAVPPSVICYDGSEFRLPQLPTYGELYAQWRSGKLVTWDSGGQWAEDCY